MYEVDDYLFEIILKNAPLAGLLLAGHFVF